jgi:acetyl-CoA carboxylase biotin carboxyl carrier protein
MDYKAIINLMKEMNQTELTKLEIEEEGVRICLEKAQKPTEDQCSPQVTFAQSQIPYPVYAPAMNYPQAGSPVAQSMPSSVSAPQAPAASATETPTEDANHKKLVSPMVGTFYAQASPDKPPFVKVGDKVKKGQTICIIEAMKLMNEIESEHDGEIIKVLVGNEDMVEYGQPLFLIK